MTTASDLPAGRELDALVAEKVMDDPVDRQIVDEHGFEIILCRSHLVLPRYSTDIAAAWTVVEKLRGCDQWPEIGATGRSWYCEFEGEPGVIVEGFGDTAPLAICRAALSAVKANP